MPDSPALTESLCPYCLCRTSARRITENNSVFLVKSCPAHGSLDKVILWKNSPYSYTEWNRQTNKCIHSTPYPDSSRTSGCPFDCGICPDHRQGTCTAIIEVTQRCNLHCPVCFASSETTPTINPTREEIDRMLQSLLDRSGPCPVQFSGGEPSLREDLPEIIALSRKMGFDHVQINTNGIRLAQDTDYGRTLKDAGATVVFLQFDGLTEEVQTRIRGTKLLQTKLRAIERCAELKLGVILVPTLLRGVNDNQIGSIIHFAKKWIPVVKGVHFQPMAYLGRYPKGPLNEERLLIPDILNAIEVQTRGELKVENFIPPGCEESHCSFSSLAVLGTDGRLIPTTRFDSVQSAGQCCGEEYARRSMDYVRSRWKYRESELTVLDPGMTPRPGCTGETVPQEDLFERIQSHSLCISGMAFQDAWNIDLERLQRCCVHVVRRDGNLVPFCAYYMTGSQGQRLYPEREEN